VAALKDLESGTLADRVAEELAGFLDEHADLLLSLSPDLRPLAEVARAAVLGGGKRLRPTFAYWGWRSVLPADDPGTAALLRAAASLELLQACALVHDDLLDASDTRRGQPAAHVRFGAHHTDQGWPGEPGSFGSAGALLLGDLLLSWAEEMFAGAGLPDRYAAGARREFDLMRTEVVAGQFLDVLAQRRGDYSADEAVAVIRLKTSKYTVARPLLLGAAAAGGDHRLRAELAAYGHAVGEAFQLRDDLLGVFGDPAETGKPAGDDLREGKRTLLVALAMAAATPDQRAVLRDGLGDRQLTEAGVTELRGLLTGTGARDAVERRIAERATEAAASLTDRLRPEARTALLELAEAAAHRRF